MGSHTEIDADETGGSGSAEQFDYVNLIHSLMAARGLGSRRLALKAGISKSRMSSIIHYDITKRMPMRLDELQRILRALDTTILQAVVSVEAIRDQQILASERYDALIAMLCRMFTDMPVPLIRAIDQVDGIDGTEIRPEWAGPLQKAVIKRLVIEVGKVALRRANLIEDDFSL